MPTAPRPGAVAMATMAVRATGDAGRRLAIVGSEGGAGQDRRGQMARVPGEGRRGQPAGSSLEVGPPEPGP